MISIFILAFAVSLDGFGVGLTYGLRNIKISILPILIISLLSGLIILLATQLGIGILQLIPSFMAEAVGGIILICIGIWSIYNSISEPKVKRKSTTDIMIIEVKWLGLLIQVLRTPSKADIDSSGEISLFEALVLGLALSLDAFGAGIGASFIGLPALQTAFTIMICSFICIYSGVKIGKTFSNVKIMQNLSYVPGLLLILLGISKIFY